MTGAAALSAAALLVGVLLEPAAATNLRTDLFTESFTGATTATSQWAVPAAGSNVACLTAGGSTATTPVKGCALGASADPSGSGTLRLTGSSGTLAGSVFSTTGIPLAQGLDVRFNSYQWRGTGADGISFVLAATDPAAPSTPVVIGATGEGLGYASAHTAPGVSSGYLGLGLDVYGNFAQTANDTSNGCGQNGSPARTPQAITVRGPGNGTSGYCVLGQPARVSGSLDKAGATSRPVPVPVEVAVNPTSAAASTATGITVPARSWAVQVTPYADGTTGGTTMAAPQTVTGALPSAAGTSPAGWVDASGVPYMVTFGWAGSTGGSTETHEISGFRATSLTGPLPVYSITATDDESGQIAVGATAAVSVAPRLGPDDGAEAAGVPVTVRTVLPSGVTPRTGSFSTGGYSCTTSGQVVTCTWTPTSPVAAGSALPVAVIPVTGSAAGAGVITAGVSSRDSNPATTTRAITVTTMTAQSTNIAYGADEALSVSGLSGSASGTVVFADQSGTLCTATLPATSCTAVRPHAGTHTVTATWTPAAGQPLTATTGFVVAKASPATTATAPSTTPWGIGAVLGLTGLDATATGTITATTAGGAPLCTATLPATSCTAPATLDVGANPVVLQYSGDGDHQASTASTVATVTKRAASLVASAVGAVHGTPVVLSAAGLTTTGSTAATGTVEFRTAAGDLLCSATLPSTTCAASAALAVGTRSVTAQYSGDAHGLAAQSAPIGVTVARAPVALVAAAPAAPVPHGTAAPLTVTGVPTGAGGTVTFTDQGARVLCSFDVAQASSCSTAGDLAAGTLTVTASYSGDASYLPAAAAPVALRLAQGSASGFTAAAALARLPFGSPELLWFSGLPADATGSVRFSDASGTLCTVPDVTVAATCATARDLAVGDRAVTATYGGDVSYPARTASAAFQVIRATTALDSAPVDPTTVYGTAARFVAGGLPAGATGTVRFLDGDGSPLCTVDLATGLSCAAPAALTAGTHRVTAQYSGDDRYTASSDSTAVTVAPAVTAVTGTVAAAPTAGTGPVLAVTGLDVRGADAATGTIVFRAEDGTVLCTATLPTTTCTPTVPMRAGRFVVRAEYSGDGNHRASVDRLAVTVPKRAIALTVRAGVRAIEPGMRLRLTVGGVGDARGSTRILHGDDVVCTVTAPDDSCDVADVRWPLGRARLTARYAGDDDHLAAEATTSVLVRQPERISQRATATTGADGRITTSGRITQPGAVQLLQRPAHGTVALVDGGWRYTAADSSTHADSFSYRVLRKDGSSAVVTVAVQGDRLAETGSTIAGPVGIGGGLLAAGLLLLVALRVLRRRRA